MKGPYARRIAVWMAAASLLTALAAHAIARDGIGGLFAVAPGMTQTDLAHRVVRAAGCRHRDLVEVREEEQPAKRILSAG